MILTDQKILQAIDQGDIVISPFDPENLGTNSYDVHISKHLAVYVDKQLDARKHNKVEEIIMKDDGYLLKSWCAIPRRN